MTTALKAEIKRLARESVREVLQEEFELARKAGTPWDKGILFNAWRDNNGKGVEASKLATSLRRSLGHSLPKKSKKLKPKAHGQNR